MHLPVVLLYTASSFWKVTISSKQFCVSSLFLFHKYKCGRILRANILLDVNRYELLLLYIWQYSLWNLQILHYFKIRFFNFSSSPYAIYVAFNNIINLAYIRILAYSHGVIIITIIITIISNQGFHFDISSAR